MFIHSIFYLKKFHHILSFKQDAFHFGGKDGIVVVISKVTSYNMLIGIPSLTIIFLLLLLL
jgi:hypothetical protein